MRRGRGRPAGVAHRRGAAGLSSLTGRSTNNSASRDDALVSAQSSIDVADLGRLTNAPDWLQIRLNGEKFRWEVLSWNFYGDGETLEFYSPDRDDALVEAVEQAITYDCPIFDARGGLIRDWTGSRRR